MHPRVSLPLLEMGCRVDCIDDVIFADQRESFDSLMDLLFSDFDVDSGRPSIVVEHSAYRLASTDSNREARLRNQYKKYIQPELVQNRAHSAYVK